MSDRIECEHGRLKRVCPLCELQDELGLALTEVGRLEDQLATLREENERLKNEVAHDLGFTGHIDEIDNEEKIVYVLIEDRYELGLQLELFKNPFEGQFIEFRQITRKWTEEEIERAKKRGKELHEFFDQIPRPEGV